MNTRKVFYSFFKQLDLGFLSSNPALISQPKEKDIVKVAVKFSENAQKKVTVGIIMSQQKVTLLALVSLNLP
jgi:hypothetical protein